MIYGVTTCDIRTGPAGLAVICTEVIVRPCNIRQRQNLKFQSCQALLISAARCLTVEWPRIEAPIVTANTGCSNIIILSYLIQHFWTAVTNIWCSHKKVRIVQGFSKIYKTFHYPVECRGMELSVSQWEGHKTGFPKELNLFLSSPPPPPPLYSSSLEGVDMSGHVPLVY